MRLRISIGMPNFEMPNLDCTSKEISIQSTIVAVRKSLVQWLTESRFGISKFGIPIEIRSRHFGARGMSSVRYRTRLGDLKNKQSTERELAFSR